jgi:hypothetical protein
MPDTLSYPYEGTYSKSSELLPEPQASPREVASNEFLSQQVMPDEYRSSAATEKQILALADESDDFDERTLILEEYVRSASQTGPVQFQSPELVEIQESMAQRQEGAYTPGEAGSLQRLVVAPVPGQIDFSDGGSGVAGMPDGFPSARQVPFRAVPPAPDKERELEDIRKGFGIAGIEAETRAAAAKVAKEEKLSKDIGEELSSFRIQPFRAYENTMFAVVAALSAAIGAAAQSLTGVPNTALKLIDDAINKDIDAQKAQYAALKDKSEVQNNVYGRAMNVLGDAKAAEKQAKLAGFSAWQQRLNALRGDRKEAVNLNATIDMFNATAQSNKDKLQMEMSAKAAKDEKKGGYRETVKGYAKEVLAVTEELALADIGVMDVLGKMGANLTPGLLALADKEDQDLIRRYNSLQSSLNVVVNAVMKTSGDSGALGEKEHGKFVKDTKKVIPTLGLLEGLSSRAKMESIKKSIVAMRLMDEMLSLDAMDTTSHPRINEIAREMGALAGSAPEASPQPGVHKETPDIKDFPGMGQFSY